MSNKTIDRLVTAAVAYGEGEKTGRTKALAEARAVLETECASLRSDLDAARVEAAQLQSLIAKLSRDRESAETRASAWWGAALAAERALEEMRGALEEAVALVGSCGHLAVAYGAAATERAVNEALPRFRALLSPSPAPSAPSTPAAPAAPSLPEEPRRCPEILDHGTPHQCVFAVGHPGPHKVGGLALTWTSEEIEPPRIEEDESPSSSAESPEVKP
jgi:hypothetical protein